MTLRLEQTGVALTEQDVTTRYNVTGTADYALVPLAGGPPVASGTVRAITGYSAPESVTSSAFASLAAQRDAERRLARRRPLARAAAMRWPARWRLLGRAGLERRRVLGRRPASRGVKLTGRDAARFLARPDRRRPACCCTASTRCAWR